MKANDKQAKKGGLLNMLPFASSSPALLNYYIYGVSVLTFAVLAITKTVSPLAFIVHAVVALLTILFFNLFVFCMEYGGCMKTALALVTFVQVIHISTFLFLVGKQPASDADPPDASPPTA